MHINRIRIENILGIEELEITPGAFTKIAGRNGEGKTSVLEAIKSVFKGGQDAELLRNGAEKGEIVLVLDDGVELRKRLTAGKAPVLDVIEDGKKVGRPTERAKALIDFLSINPIDFILARRKQDRIDALLAALPMKVDGERVEKIIGFKPNFQLDLPAIAILDHLYKTLFDDRTGTNRSIRDKEGTINQLEATLPPADEEGKVYQGEDELEAKIADINARETAEMERITTKLAGLREERDKAIEEQQAIIAAAQAAIAKLREDFTETEGKANHSRTVHRENFAREREAPAAQLAAIKADREAAARHKATAALVAKQYEELTALQQTAAGQTESLEGLQAYKAELLAKLPIDGLEVKDGDIFRHGVMFDRLNTAQQVEIAVEIAKLRAGPLGVICVDRIESLDSESFDIFRTRAVESGLQLFVTEVSDDDGLNITTEG